MRYYLTETKEVTKEEFINAERKVGFYPKSGNAFELATIGFSSSNLSGSIKIENNEDTTELAGKDFEVAFK